MPFHRFTQPSYPGIGAIPAGPASIAFNGVNYSFINVVSGGTGGAGSAPADTSKSFGPNVGTYFLAFGETGQALNSNRGLRALAENTDYLDDVLNRAMAVPTRTPNATAGAPVTTITLPANTFVGNTLTYPLNELFTVVDQLDNEIVVGAFAVVVSSIAGAAVGDGFSAAPVVLTLNNSIPAGTTYRVYYSTRSSLAAMPQDALSFISIRGAQQLNGYLQATISDMKGAYSGGWYGPSATTLTDAAYGGLNQRYSRATSASDDRPTTLVAEGIPYTLDTPGSGGFFSKTGSGVVGVSQFTGTTSQENSTSMFMGATWAAWSMDHYIPATINDRMARNSGFVFSGHGSPRDTTLTPGLFSFLHTSQVGEPLSPLALNAGRASQVRPGVTVSLTGDQLTLSSGWFYKNLGGGDETDIHLFHDIFRVTVAGTVHHFVLAEFVSATQARIRYVEGATPNFAAATPGTILDWQKVMLSVSDNAAFTLDGLTGITAGGDALTDFNTGAYFNAERDTSVTANSVFRFVGSEVGGGPVSDPVLSWGYRAHVGASKGRYIPLGNLTADGRVLAQTVYAPAVSSNNWFVFADSAGSPSNKSFTVRHPLRSYNIEVPVGTYTTTPLGYESAILGSQLVFTFRPFNGAKLAKVVVWVAVVNAGATLPAVPPSVTVTRYPNLVNGQATAAWSAGVASLHTASPGGSLVLPVLGTDYRGHIFKIEAICDNGATNIIDNSQYIYTITVEDESGAGGTTHNVYFAVDFVYENVNTLYPFA